MASPAAKDIIRVGLEEAAPITSKGKDGIIEKIFKEIEKEGELEFRVDYMTYGRALVELREGRIDLIGITPTGNETPEFYKYAVDLDWSFKTYNILFYLEKNAHLEYLSDFKTIGTPSGNEAFMADMMGLELDHFHGGQLTSLFKMLEKDRLDAVIFEGISSLTLLKQLEMPNIKYRLVNPMKGGLSVSKRKINLKKRIEKAIQRTNWKKYFLESSVIEDFKRAKIIKIRPPKI